MIRKTLGKRASYGRAKYLRSPPLMNFRMEGSWDYFKRKGVATCEVP